MEAVVTTGAISRAKLQSNHHYQQTNTQFNYRPDALPVAQPTVSKHWRENITLLGLIIIIIKIVHEVQKDRIRQKKGQNNQHVHK